MSGKATTTNATTVVSNRPPGRAAVDVDDLPGPGATLAGKYELVRELGRGGMGVVVEARDLRLGRRVAIKMIAPGAWQTPELVARFEREARAAARLQSPHAVRLLDVDVAKGAGHALPFMVMEYLEGRGLDEELAERGPLPVGEAVRYLLEACEAMAEAHAAGIVHRDLKPSNLFVCRDGAGRRTLKVLDFGISKLTNEGERALTQTRSTFGTPEYMSPEQVRAKGPLDGRADVWSLGVVLFQLLSGSTPFPGDTVPSVFAAIITDPPQALGPLRPDLPPGLEFVLMQALRKDPRERFSSAEAFAEALAPFAEALAPRFPSGAAYESHPPAQAITRRRSWVDDLSTVPSPARRKARLIGIALASAVAGVAGVWFGWGADQMRAVGGAPSPAVSMLPATPREALPEPPPVEAAHPPVINVEPVASSRLPLDKAGPAPKTIATSRGKAPESAAPAPPGTPVISPTSPPPTATGVRPPRPPAPAPSTGPATPIGPDGHPTRI